MSTDRVTLVLRRLEMAGDSGTARGSLAHFQFHWDTELPGSAKHPHTYAYPFICEAKANSKLIST